MPETTINFTNIEQGKANCYFKVEWKDTLPDNYRVYLCVGRRNNFVDVTKGFTRTELFPLARCFRAWGQWNQPVDCWLEGGFAPAGIGNVTSNVRQIVTPVRPFCGPLTTRMIANEPIPFSYTGTGVGRFFDPDKLDGCAYYMKYGSSLETDPKMRGMDCTTFPRSLFELNSDVAGSMPGNNYAAVHIANDLGASAVGIEGVSKTQMMKDLFGLDAEKNFLAWPKEGLYILWTTGHIMLYRGEKDRLRYGIHEFTGSGSGGREWKAIGYKETGILNRTFYSGPYWARKIPSTHEWRVINTTLSDYFTSDFPEEMNPAGGVSIGTPKGSTPVRVGTGGGGAAPKGKSYTVVSGDSLSAIAGKFYGDVLLWPIIYDANKQTVGSDPNKIYPGQKLTIPDIGGYSSQQLTDARNRGKNWR